MTQNDLFGDNSPIFSSATHFVVVDMLSAHAVADVLLPRSFVCPWPSL